MENLKEMACLLEDSICRLLVRKYKYSMEDAKELLYKYSFIKKATENPDYYFHNPESYWAEYIDAYYGVGGKVPEFLINKSNALSVAQLKQRLKEKTALKAIKNQSVSYDFSGILKKHQENILKQKCGPSVWIRPIFPLESSVTEYHISLQNEEFSITIRNISNEEVNERAIMKGIPNEYDNYKSVSTLSL